jgi:hypothetical protein
MEGKGGGVERRYGETQGGRGSGGGVCVWGGGGSPRVVESVQTESYSHLPVTDDTRVHVLLDGYSFGRVYANGGYGDGGTSHTCCLRVVYMLSKWCLLLYHPRRTSSSPRPTLVNPSSNIVYPSPNHRIALV